MSHKIHLSLEETYQLADRMEQTRNRKLSRRLLAISLRHFGYKVKDIAAITGVSDRTVTKWFKLYLEGGLDALLEQHYKKERGSVLQPHKEAIIEYFELNPTAKLEELQHWLNAEKGVEVEYSWLYRYLERKGIRTGRRGRTAETDDPGS